MKNIISKINMKYLFVVVPLVLIILLICVSLISGTREDKKNGEKQKIEDVTYFTKDNRISYTFKGTFKKQDVGEYDLYVKDDDRQLIMGVFTYDLNNYEENTAIDVLNKQIEYFLKTRNDMVNVKQIETKDYDDKVISKIEYSGKTTDSSDCIYVFSVTEFKSNPGYIIYSTNVIIKKHYNDYIKEINNVLESIKLN